MEMTPSEMKKELFSLLLKAGLHPQDFRVSVRSNAERRDPRRNPFYGYARANVYVAVPRGSEAYKILVEGGAQVFYPYKSPYPIVTYQSSK